MALSRSRPNTGRLRNPGKKEHDCRVKTERLNYTILEIYWIIIGKIMFFFTDNKIFQKWTDHTNPDMRLPVWPLWVARRQFTASTLHEAKKAVVFDLGGVILPSPFAAAAGETFNFF